MIEMSYADATPPSLSARGLWRMGILSGSFRHSLGTGLMCMVVFEAALLGSGQMLQLGGVTLKMILFGLSVVYTLVSLYCGDRISLSSTLLLSSLFASIAIASLIGFVQGADPKFIAEDVSPQLYFLLLPFFELTMGTARKLDLVTRIILIGALIMSAGYAVILGGLWFGAISIVDLYKLLTTIGRGDFMYDGQTFRVFYKGSLYLGVAVILFAFRRGRWAKIGMCISFIVLLLTATRGFLLAILMAALLYVLIGPARTRTKMAYAFLILVVGAVSVPVVLGIGGDKAESNSDRLITVNEVADRVGLVSAVIGHGFGTGVPQRPEHMEITYLEIFHKQGVIGLLWLASVGTVLTLRLRKAVKVGNEDLAYPLFLCAVFVFIESITNPFINNPIGLSVLVVCIAGLRVLAEPRVVGVSSERSKAIVYG
jgi:hypothetical protein